MALQRMGIVKNYEDIRAKTVIVVGVGGVGSDWCFNSFRIFFISLKYSTIMKPLFRHCGDADSLWNRKADPFRLR